MTHHRSTESYELTDWCISSLPFVLAFLFLLGLLSPPRTSPWASERARRCSRSRARLVEGLQLVRKDRRVSSWLQENVTVEETVQARAPDRVMAHGLPTGTRFRLERKAMRSLIAMGYLKGVPVCPEQGPLYRPDSWHFKVRVTSPTNLSISCPLHR